MTRIRLALAAGLLALPATALGIDSTDAAEEVMLDGNELARGQKFFSGGGLKVSDDGTKLAFLTDTTGFREYFVSVKDLATGKVTESKFVKASHVEWAADGRTLFYV